MLAGCTFPAKGHAVLSRCAIASSMTMASTEDLMPGGPVQRLRNPPELMQCTIWRFMSLEKFQNMLESNCLYFPRANLLGDRYEGSVPLKHLRMREEQIEELLPHLQGQDKHRRKTRDELLSTLANYGKTLPSRMFVSCWHLRESESDFWHLYADRRTSICLRSTFERLYVQLAPHAVVGSVRYVDYDSAALPGDAATPFGPFFYKRHAYAHESEARAVIWWFPRFPADWRTPPRGLSVPTNLEILLDGVYYSPYSEPRFSAIVKRVMADHRLYVPLQPSSLARQPSY